MIRLFAILMCFGLSAQEFDFSCPPHPEEFLADFLADAKKYGHDFDNQEGTIEYWYEVPPGKSSPHFDHYVGASLNSCADGYNLIINANNWESYYFNQPTAEKGRLRVKLVMYHELGHALLERAHICNLTGNIVPGADQVHYDIMQSPGVCQDEYGVYIFEQYPWNDPDVWDTMVKRLFEGTGQEQLSYVNCGYAGKGKSIIYD